MSTIVIGYTPTAPAKAALLSAVEEAKMRNAELVVVNSSTGDRYTDPAFASPEEIGELRAVLADSGLTYEILQPLRGRDGAEEVLLAAQERAADLIVIGVRRRTAVGKLLLGSTAQTIIMGAHCDVLAVRA
jgi:nucleotide-binding universal stress UspA family protein